MGSAKGLRDELERKTLAFPNVKNATLMRRLFTREPRAHPSGDGAHWYDLETLFKLCAKGA